VQSARKLQQIIQHQPPGSWIAISIDGRRVVGTALTREEAEGHVRLHGEAAAFLLHVPEKRNGNHTKQNGR